ncbi:MAG: RdgB/HAM1 family non-canonical purine NTP pyrophosphatase [Candidatus Neomarinimicrobiota bacterium]|nr:RdgB/HAM1 family non-canonical purine NTP pyrophosphatase [Candidatus Neomarinimicrobiota bacterium]MEE3195602.1 RdgB/HAM1 family non-canonical purine NTP pyrophosphatase [Candidatus Neomarinimicrobiota bacterium]|tara:strand:- start:135 stop:725 length:591 start_codon:yes stop_codon:yes gene_type:complete
MKIILATHNRDKEKELQNSLLGINVEICSLFDFPEIGDIEETGTTLLENSLLKARTVFDITGIPTIADDTGLEVDFLDGAPGVYSARYAGNNVSYQDNVNKLLIELDGVPHEKRKAKFRTVVTYIDKNDELWTEGHIDGIISESIIGDGGFGYDPIFFVPHIGKTFAELSSAEKNKISHRGIALQKLRKILINVLK